MVSLLTHWFAPHYTNNHRPKILQPVGLSLVVAVFILVSSSLQLMELAPSLPGGFVLGYASSISADQVIVLTNSERAKAGLPPLSMNNKLNQAALAKANHMFMHNYWAHVAPDGTTPWSFIKSAGYAYTVAGENLARDFGDTESMVQAWMNSETHKANIVHKKYSQIGVAVVNGKLDGVETTLVVQMFGTPTTAIAKIDPPPVAAKPVDIAELEPVVTPIPEMPPAEIQNNQQVNGAKVNYVSPLTLVKGVGASLVALIAIVLSYDSIMMAKKGLPRRVGNNWAHIGLFSVVILIIIAMAQGRVL